MIEIAARTRFRRGIQCETVLRNTQKRALHAEPIRKRIAIGEERLLCCGSMALKIPEGSMRKLESCVPAPAAIHNRAQLHTASHAPHVQICEWRAGCEVRPRKIPIFIARIEISREAQSRIVKERSRNGTRVSALLRIPSHQ